MTTLKLSLKRVFLRERDERICDWTDDKEYLLEDLKLENDALRSERKITKEFIERISKAKVELDKIYDLSRVLVSKNDQCLVLLNRWTDSVLDLYRIHLQSLDLKDDPFQEVLKQASNIIIAWVMRFLERRNSDIYDIQTLSSVTGVRASPVLYSNSLSILKDKEGTMESVKSHINCISNTDEGEGSPTAELSDESVNVHYLRKESHDSEICKYILRLLVI